MTVIPSEYGSVRKWHWPVTQYMKHPTTPQTKHVTSNIADLELSLEDDDVRLERTRVQSGNYDQTCPLIVNGMRKEYAGRGGSGPTLAVKDVTIAVEEGITFGLLGPNGAGKSTLISILTGLYNATAGESSIAGYDIVLERDQVYGVLGVCPQHDILWVSFHFY